MSAARKKRVFINARFLTQPITGVQRYAHEMVSAWDRLLERGEIDPQRYTFQLVAPPRGIRHRLPWRHIGFRQIGHFTGHLWEQTELPFVTLSGVLFCPGNTAPLFSLFSWQKTVVTVHDLSYRYFPDAYSRAFRGYYRFLMPLIFRKATALITVSQSERASILQYYPRAADRLVAIQNGGIAGDRFPEQTGGSPGEFALYVGALSRRKNFQGVLQALSLVNREMNLPLKVAGGSGKTFRRGEFKIPDNLTGKVEFLGQVDDTERLLSLYRKACCLVFPSFYEASPLPPLEAMASGCPVLASDIPSLRERCADAALYSNPHDPADIAAKIVALRRDPGLREALRRKGIERAREFTWERAARETWEVIRCLF